MKTKRTIITFIIILLFITGFRLVWHQFLTLFDVPNQPEITNGVLDLRGHEWSSYQTLQLNGEWEFYPNTLMDDLQEKDKQLITAPSDWKSAFKKNDEQNDSFTYGTYKLHILLDEDVQKFGMRMIRIENASAVYANGKLIAKSGNPSSNLTDYVPKQIPTTVKVPVENGEIDLTIEVANHTSSGGIVKNIRFGTMGAIDKYVSLSLGTQLLLIIVFSIHSIYTIVLYFVTQRFKGLLYHSLIMLLGIMAIITDDDKLLFIFIDIDYQWTIKVMILAYIIGISLTVPFTNNLFPGHLSKRIEKLFQISAIGIVLFVLVAPMQLILTAEGLFYILAVAFISIPAYILWKAVQEQKDVTYLLLAVLIILNNLIWSIVLATYSSEFMHYPFDLIFALFAFSAFWFQQFYEAMDNSEKLALKLQMEDKRKDAFLVNTSHELRNPLHGMMNITQIMLNDQNGNLSPDQQRQLKLHLHISKHLSLLVEDLLDITRLKEQQIELNEQSIQLSSIVTGVIDTMKLSVGDKKVSLKQEIPENLPLIWADEQRLIQVLFNLLHNAVKYTEEGTITVSALAESSWVRIDVADTGIGITEVELATIFDPYEQGKTQSDNPVEGLGLGLTICKKLIDLHGGEIYAKSVVGQGTTFSFTLPLAQQKEVFPSANIIPDVMEQTEVSEEITSFEYIADKDIKRQTKANILLVDDDYTNLLVIRQVLETERYHVTTAMDAGKALAILNSTAIDLVVSDVMMPAISGYELTRQIRSRYSLAELPVLLLTARTQSEDLLTGFTAGANDYVKKPVDALELKARVQSLINLKKALEEHTQMEGAWLQSQIQPHFIFNTLNTIASLGISDMEKMQDLLEEFSTYLRYSFDFKNAEPVIPLSRELTLVESYVYIEQQRFGERLHVDWAIPSNINIFIPPLSIQPLVENAIKHGLLRKTEGGTICIQVVREADYYELIVSDDGVGMTDEEIAILFTVPKDDKKQKSTRVGLRNINKRLKQLYDTSIIIKSTPDKGTTVSFMIPKQLADQKKSTYQNN